MLVAEVVHVFPDMDVDENGFDVVAAEIEDSLSHTNLLLAIDIEPLGVLLVI